MTLASFLILVLIAAICGALGQALAGYTMGGCLVSIGVGFVGAFLGAWIASEFGLPPVFVVEVGGQPFPVFWAIVGSALFSAVLGAIGRRRI